MAQRREWRQTIVDKTYLVSTDRTYISHDFVQRAFESPDMYWAKPLKSFDLNTMLQNSCCLGLYITTPHTQPSAENLVQIGFARFITDYVTFAYLTDVYILPELQGKGLGKWLIACCKEIIEGIPELRRALLLTSASGKGVKFYQRELEMLNINDFGEGFAVMMTKNTGPKRVEDSL